MAVPNMYNTVVETANKYPQEFREAHTGGARTELWIKLLAYELHKLDPRWGLNGKRGTDTLSQDAVNFKGEGVGTDPSRNDAPITVVDVIGAAGGPDPKPTWQVFNDPVAHRGPGKWIQPEPVPGYHDLNPNVPSPPVPKPPTDTTLINAVQAVESQLKLNTQLQEKLLQELVTLATAVNGLSSRLDKGFSIKAKAGWPVGDVNGEVKLKE